MSRTVGSIGTLRCRGTVCRDRQAELPDSAHTDECLAIRRAVLYWCPGPDLNWDGLSASGF